MVLRLKLVFAFMSLIAVYDVIEMFYTKLASVADSCPRRDIRIVLGDFNAVSGCDRAGYEMSVGPHGSGADIGSENSFLSRDFVKSQKLRISGSWYQHPDPQCWTWYNDAGNATKEIDQIPISTRSLQNYRVYRSTKLCGNNHRLVVTTLRVHFKTPQRSNDHPRVFHLDRLKEECVWGFVEAISGRFTALDNLTDPVLLWDTFKCKTLDAAQESIGERLRTIQNFISQEILEATDACRVVRLTGDRDLHYSQVTAVRLLSGQIVSDPVVVRECLAEYFEQLYQVNPPRVSLDTAGSEPMAWGLHAVLAARWQPGQHAPNLLRGVVIPLWKGKGDRWDCSSHRDITLLSIPGKVLAHILLRRIRDHLLRHQKPEQSGFTIDRILTFRVTVERRCEFRHGLLAVYIDLKKVFDMFRIEARLCSCTNTFQYLHGLDSGQRYCSKSLWSNTGQYQGYRP
ncbi:uncharacterized protein [Penaeus vannamei]|uniref:uncharacterized protein n=1 Tax=Penaeus vannamei TaxID=6689 RepID=UPI00387F559C